MDYEKKYKKALEWMQGLYSGLHGATKEEAEHYFPELKKTESEDERIKKAIIAYISHDQHCGVSNADMIAWLEKQDKKKSADEVMKIRRELYQSGYNDGYKHGQMDYADDLNREAASSVKLDADNVWLQNYISNVTCLVNQLKKDFGL